MGNAKTLADSVNSVTGASPLGFVKTGFESAGSMYQGWIILPATNISQQDGYRDKQLA